MAQSDGLLGLLVEPNAVAVARALGANGYFASVKALALAAKVTLVSARRWAQNYSDIGFVDLDWNGQSYRIKRIKDFPDWLAPLNAPVVVPDASDVDVWTIDDLPGVAPFEVARAIPRRDSKGGPEKARTVPTRRGPTSGKSKSPEQLPRVLVPRLFRARTRGDAEKWVALFLLDQQAAKKLLLRWRQRSKPLDLKQFRRRIHELRLYEACKRAGLVKALELHPPDTKPRKKRSIAQRQFAASFEGKELES